MTVTSQTLPSYLFFYGLAGSGKNHCARVIGNALGYAFHDFDDDLTPPMIQAVNEQRHFTEEMRTEYFQKVCSKIAAFKTQHPKVIFHQAAYKERLRNIVKSAHPDVTFIWIDAPLELVRQRVAKRSGEAMLKYVESFMHNFEVSSVDKRLFNDEVADSDLVNRFTILF